jgi:hypothetical protein
MMNAAAKEGDDLAIDPLLAQALFSVGAEGDVA